MVKMGPSKTMAGNEAISMKYILFLRRVFESYGAPRIKVELLNMAIVF